MNSCCALFVLSGEGANIYSTLGAFQATSLNNQPMNCCILFFFHIKCTKHLIFLSVKDLVILTTPSQARPTMIVCMQAFSSINVIIISFFCVHQNIL